MSFKKYYYKFVVQESHLDKFNHVNNATYLILFEDARWQMLNQNGYTIEKILETQIGPTILEIKIAFLKELRLGDEITIETQTISYQQKIGILLQKMLRQDSVCCTAEFVLSLFDLKQRRLISPTEDWLSAIGVT